MRPDFLAYLLSMNLDEPGAGDNLTDLMCWTEGLDRRAKPRTAVYGKRSDKSFLAPPRPSWDTIH
jgi:hypothetical protein